ncbi:MAG: peptide-methionine (R)-S-oxide reductase MsrB [Parvibaculum sp.]|uniref:peptide-methionine (R)-S-oxide reductase MsrB n=1 Tax=Parvibaculum sp. TaxID=2024848 RepID=UPI002AB8398D|nr:peptide-methionine (R)-S-oxide reductase MsrB [Parvibaculum sp.]MDZ4381328.1 peptide-methionine (R)-S-oxide reductase MsrB [Parvibaculum sp.]
MMSRRKFLGSTAVAGALAAAGAALRGASAEASESRTFEVTKTKAEWKELLTPEQYYVLREHGTERPGSSPLNKEKRQGAFRCAACDLALFSSDTKYESGTGWPSFYAPLDNAVGTSEDSNFFMTRTEVHCRRCGGHLGHVFDDGPPPTGKRYCMNGVAMTFKPAGAA